VAFRVASRGTTKRVIAKVTTSQNTIVKKVTLGRPVHAVNANGAGGASSMAQLSDVTLVGIENGSVLVYNTATSKWEPVLLLNQQEFDGGFY